MTSQHGVNSNPPKDQSKEDSTLDKILQDFAVNAKPLIVKLEKQFDTWPLVASDINEQLAELMTPYTTLKSETAQSIKNYCQEQVIASVYGFHEYIMGKNIIQPEKDQAYNYARLHKVLDSYIKELRGSDE